MLFMRILFNFSTSRYLGTVHANAGKSFGYNRFIKLLVALSLKVSPVGAVELARNEVTVEQAMPREVLVQVFSYLTSSTDLCALSKVSKSFRGAFGYIISLNMEMRQGNYLPSPQLFKNLQKLKLRKSTITILKCNEKPIEIKYLKAFPDTIRELSLAGFKISCELSDALNAFISLQKLDLGKCDEYFDRRTNSDRSAFFTSYLNLSLKGLRAFSLPLAWVEAGYLPLKPWHRQEYIASILKNLSRTAPDLEQIKINMWDTDQRDIQAAILKFSQLKHLWLSNRELDRRGWASTLVNNLPNLHITEDPGFAGFELEGPETFTPAEVLGITAGK